MNGKFTLVTIVLVFVTISLVFNMDFSKQSALVFDSMGISVEKETGAYIDKMFDMYTPEEFKLVSKDKTFTNTIDKETFKKFTDIIDLEKEFNYKVERGYKNNDFITVRYFTNEDENLVDNMAKIYEKLENDGYKEKDGIYKKGKVEITIYEKWQSVIFAVKGL